MDFQGQKHDGVDEMKSYIATTNPGYNTKLRISTLLHLLQHVHA